MLRTIIMQYSRLIQACFPIKIDEEWTDFASVMIDDVGGCLFQLINSSLPSAA